MGQTSPNTTCTILTRITHISPSNILMDCGSPDKQITDVRLAEFGSTVHVDSRYAHDLIGSTIFRSPGAVFTDGFAGLFGATVRQLYTWTKF